MFGFGHPVECHEKWEFDEVSKIQKLVDLMSLCPPCHRVKHFGRTSSIGGSYLDQAKKHFLKVNEVNSIDMINHINYSFKLFEKRSKEEWTLDISSLKDILEKSI